MSYVVKSGRDYSIHKALDRFVSNPDYKVGKSVVLSNEPEVPSKGTHTLFPHILCDVFVVQADFYPFFYSFFENPNP